jgi:hypothetical protein
VRAILRSLEPQSCATFWRACRHSPDAARLSTIAELADKMRGLDPPVMASVEIKTQAHLHPQCTI